MSNRNFDRLWAQTELMNAKSALKAYGTALVRTDITEQDVEFLSRAVKAAKEYVEQARRELATHW